MKLKLLVTFVFFMAAFASYAEIIYMNDGQVIKGQILKEDASAITVKTKYQTQVLRKKHISRIMYGDRDLEEVSILKNDGSTIDGFLVDQDSKQVILRKIKTSPEEIIIKKTEIKQISPKAIIPLKPGISFKIGMYNPLTSNGADLQPSLIFLGSMGFNLPFVRNMRMFLEAGYTKSNGNAGDSVYMQIVPITLNANYNYKIGNFFIIPRIGAGLSVVEFNDGLNAPKQGYDFTAIGGLGVEYEVVERTFRIGFYGDYMLLKEKKASMNNVVGAVGALYCF